MFTYIISKQGYTGLILRVVYSILKLFLQPQNKDIYYNGHKASVQEPHMAVVKWVSL